MKEFIRNNRAAVLIAAVLIVVLGAIAALVVNHNMRGVKAADTSEVVHDLGQFPEGAMVHDSQEGEIVIGVSDDESMTLIEPTSLLLVSDPEIIWSDTAAYAGNHTPVEAAKMEDGSIGVLTIPGLRLSVNIYESPDNLEAMRKGIAHFPATSAFDGNVGVSAHNINLDGSAGYFKDLHVLKQGDVVQLKTGLGERTYAVSSITTIAASDWSPLSYTDDNRLTMITCISGQPDKRLCVQAVEQA